jgi:outer membrane receptor protein involved in Fe transport
MELRATFGLQARSDTIENGLHHAYQRKIIGTTVDAGVNETSVGLFTEQDLRITPWFRVVGGLRLDRFDVAVKDHLEQQDPSAPATSGIAGSTLASPKISWVLSPLRDKKALLDFYLNFGRGFHSNDARGAVRSVDRVTLLTKATSWEVGARLGLWKKLDLAAALFRIDLDSETVWSGDEGTTEAVGPTRRKGIELEARLKVLPWLFLDADATFTDAVYRENAGNGSAVALAPRRTLAGGVSVKHPSGVFGAVRVRSIAARPAIEDNSLTAEGWTLFDATAGFRHGWFEAAVDVRNVFNREWKEVQFANESRTRREVNDPSYEGRPDIHFTPGWPLTVLGRVTAYF